MFTKLVVLAFLALAFVSTVSAQSNSTIIYIDYTSGFTALLPNSMVFAQADSRVYNTRVPGSYQFGVDWNNDASDLFTITIPSTVNLTALNNASFCTPNATSSPANQITFTATSVHVCNYSVSWNVPFSGVLSVTYDNGPNTPGGPRSDTISTFFTNTSVVGDPQFIGLRGQSFQVHGVDGAVYNLISDSNLQVNSRFVFLTEGECPVIEGVPDMDCWSHPGSYLGEMSFQSKVEGKLHAALITAGDAKTGFSMVQMDGKALKVGDKVVIGAFSIELLSSHKVSVQTEQFDFQLSNSDLFINQALRSKVALSKLSTHGLLGQTHSTKTHRTPLRHIEGDVDDYVIADNDIFGDDFVYNKFQ